MKHSQFQYSPHSTSLVCGHYKESRGFRTVAANGVPDWLLIYTMSGLGQFRHRDVTFKVAAGDAVLCRPNTFQDYGTDKDVGAWELAWAHFQPRALWLEWLNWPEQYHGMMCKGNLSDDAQMETERALADMNRLAQRSDNSRFNLVMNALERAFLWAGGVGSRDGLDRRVQLTIDCILSRVSEHVTINELAEVVNLSPSRFGHLFHAETGKTPMQFLEEERIARACEQLRATNRKIGSIGTDLGFDNLFYFSRRFSLRMGMSPSCYRQQSQLDVDYAATQL